MNNYKLTLAGDRLVFDSDKFTIFVNIKDISHTWVDDNRIMIDLIDKNPSYQADYSIDFDSAEEAIEAHKRLKKWLLTSLGALAFPFENFYYHRLELEDKRKDPDYKFYFDESKSSVSPKACNPSKESVDEYEPLMFEKGFEFNVYKRCKDHLEKYFNENKEL